MAAYGYIRVSTNKGQTTDNQRKEILDADFTISDWFSEDGVSGKVPQLERPAFRRMLATLKAGDSVVVSKIDRLGRTATDTLNTLREFTNRKVKVVVLQLGGLDLTSAPGKLVMTCLAAVAEMELDLNVDRINMGLVRTKEQGTILGPPLKIEPRKLREICADRAEGLTLDKIAAKHGVQRSSIDRNVKAWGSKLDVYEKEYNTRSAQYKLSEQKRIEKAKRA